MKTVHKIVLTGGPCAGKTTALSCGASSTEPWSLMISWLCNPLYKHEKRWYNEDIVILPFLL